MKPSLLSLGVTLLSSSQLLTSRAAALPRRWQPVPVKWENCSTPVPDGMDCATLSVPLDWNDPSGKKITLGLNRLRATGDSASTENMIINPAGPGGIATAALVEVASGEFPISPQLRSKYNLSKSELY